MARRQWEEAPEPEHCLLVERLETGAPLVDGGGRAAPLSSGQ